jgi:hypothetical protein
MFANLASATTSQKKKDASRLHLCSLGLRFSTNLTEIRIAYVRTHALELLAGGRAGGHVNKMTIRQKTFQLMNLRNVEQLR